MENLGNLELWGLLLATIVPWVVGVINRAYWESTTKFITLVAVSVAVSAGNAYFNGTLFDDGDFVRSLLVVLVGASVAYKLWQRPVQNLERQTTPIQNLPPGTRPDPYTSRDLRDPLSPRHTNQADGYFLVNPYEGLPPASVGPLDKQDSRD